MTLPLVPDSGKIFDEPARHVNEWEAVQTK
jgi:hypothetical protein